MVCFIDDHSFNELLPNWTPKLNYIGEPFNYKIRHLGLMSLLYEYGGMLIPNSFLCLQNMITLYDNAISNNMIGIGEIVNYKNFNNQNTFIPSSQFIWCEKNNELLLEYINFISNIIATDYTDQSIFLDEFNTWFLNKQIMLVNGKLLGTKTINNNPLFLNNLYKVIH